MQVVSIYDEIIDNLLKTGFNLANGIGLEIDKLNDQNKDLIFGNLMTG